MTIQIQKPVRSQREGVTSGALVFPNAVFTLTNVLLGLINIMRDRVALGDR